MNSYVSCMAISKVIPVATLIWPLSGSMSNAKAPAPKWMYARSASSTSVAATAAPTLAPGAALSDTLRVVGDGANVGASFTAMTVMVTVAVFESRVLASFTR